MRSLGIDALRTGIAGMLEITPRKTYLDWQSVAQLLCMQSQSIPRLGLLLQMKHAEAMNLPNDLLTMSHEVGGKLARLRKARRLRQSDVALRAGVSRSTAVLIEAGNPSRTLSQVLRYLNAISPGSTLLDLLQEVDPALVTLRHSEETKRVRKLSAKELGELDF
jgi:transcriptional regulator with XRE-family HTH domain